MGKTIAKIFGGGDAPKPPTPPKPVPMADPEALKRAKKKSLAEQRKRGGRESTILTDDTLG